MRQGPNSRGAFCVGPSRHSVLITVASSYQSHRATDGHEWPLLSRMLGLSPPRIFQFQRSKSGRQPRETCRPLTTCAGDNVVTIPAKPPRYRATRSHIAEWLCPTRLRPQRRADLSCEGEVQRDASTIPRGATRDRTFARSNVANGSARKRSKSPHQLDGSSTARFSNLAQLSWPRSVSKPVIVSTSDPISCGLWKNTSAPASRAIASTGVAESITIGAQERWANCRALWTNSMPLMPGNS